ncbi:6-phosphogluconolactonase [Thiomicrorhabdus indica]|uniref:6-phosphogluconolactonase n=1 Tax=Thiomicrorhabdus indica TaxID=2267253 RepID=UPI002AA8905A|nr:6-phosphogluconolactonase [Thiomicrorhabdus indica]
MSQVKLPSNWQVFKTSDVIAQNACDKIIEIANQAISVKGRFDFVTAGGTTPNAIYALLAKLEQQQPKATKWKKWFIYVGDERVLPAGDNERNSQMLESHWLDNSRIPKSNRFYMPTELGLQAAADFYRKVIAGVEFDLVLLGMGEDGHTASLFPGHSSVSLGGVVCETQSPKPPLERLSLSYETLSSAKTVMKIVTGRSKSEALHAWLDDQDLPITRVKGVTETLVMVDQEAIADFTDK